ncbi:hypothetical protein Tco_0922000 [Tanacetum coccineum]|uniref:Uncharacterized protein n=1 Tax=Tanacetum coccineum TaxID=301880 RepID=A0ABQ5CWV3_9ASTR
MSACGEGWSLVVQWESEEAETEASFGRGDRAHNEASGIRGDVRRSVRTGSVRVLGPAKGPEYENPKSLLNGRDECCKGCGGSAISRRLCEEHSGVSESRGAIFLGPQTSSPAMGVDEDVWDGGTISQISLVGVQGGQWVDWVSRTTLECSEGWARGVWSDILVYTELLIRGALLGFIKPISAVVLAVVIHLRSVEIYWCVRQGQLVSTWPPMAGILAAEIYKDWGLTVMTHSDRYVLEDREIEQLPTQRGGVHTTGRSERTRGDIVTGCRSQYIFPTTWKSGCEVLARRVDLSTFGMRYLQATTLEVSRKLESNEKFDDTGTGQQDIAARQEKRSGVKMWKSDMNTSHGQRLVDVNEVDGTKGVSTVRRVNLEEVLVSELDICHIDVQSEGQLVSRGGGFVISTDIIRSGKVRGVGHERISRCRQGGACEEGAQGASTHIRH